MSELYYVYMLKCSDKKGKITFYTGYTNDPDRRLKEHSTGKGARYTAMRTVLEMAIITTTQSRSNAMKYEREIKKLPRFKKLELYQLAILNDRGGGND